MYVCLLEGLGPGSTAFAARLLFAVTDTERETYTRIIDDILLKADLQTVTRKKIRQGLEEAIDKDLSEQKVCVISPAGRRIRPGVLTVSIEERDQDSDRSPVRRNLRRGCSRNPHTDLWRRSRVVTQSRS